MTKPRNRRSRFFANVIHKEIFLLVFFASLLPAFIVTILLYYLIFNITAEQVGIPEAIAYTILPAAQKVMIILAISAPVAIVMMLVFAHQVTHRIVGPFDRVVRELDECLKGTKKDHIMLRKNDKFEPLVGRINLLLDQARKK